MMRWAMSLLVPAFLVHEVFACSCIPRSACKQFDDASVVFVGKVERKSVISPEPTDLNDVDAGQPPLEISDVTVTLSVLEALKGTLSGSVEVHTTETCCICGYAFEVGETYLVFAHRGDDEILSTGMCSGTEDIALATALLPQLRQLSETGRSASLYGQVVQRSRDGADFSSRRVGPLAGLTVRASTPKQEFRAVTDSQGVYVFHNLPPGEYDLSYDLPGWLVLADAEPDSVKIGSQGLPVSVLPGFGECGLSDITVFTNGTISGRVLRPGGTPASGYIHLVPAGLDAKKLQEGEGDGLESLQEGLFAFRGLSAGKFKLYYEGPGDSKGPNIYYPGVLNYEEAAEIAVGDAEQIENLVFQLPPIDLVPRPAEPPRTKNDADTTNK